MSLDVIETPPVNLRVLLLPPTAKDGELTQRILDQENVETTICTSIDQFCDEAGRGVGLMLIAEEHLLADRTGQIKTFLAAQPAWSDIPLLILMLRTSFNNAILQKWQRDSHVTLIGRPLRIQPFISTVQSRITDRKRQYVVRDLLESLDRRGQEFRQLADSMPNIVFGADAEGNLTYLNQNSFEYIGRELELYGAGWINAIAPEDRDRAIARWQTAIKTGQTYQIEFRVFHKASGKYRWHIARGLPVRDGGKIVQWFGTCTDIHEQKLIQEKLNVALDNADAANRAKSEFLANMSHEIRTPMTAVLGYANLLAEDEQDPEKLGFLRIIRRNGNFLLEIINDILDLSKIEAGKLEIIRQRFEVHDLVFEVCSMMQVRAAERKIRLDVEFPQAIPAAIESDPKRLRQILVNLVGNAIKFTESGGVKIIVTHTDKQLQIEVVDTGIGITAKQMKNLFQPFHQADASVSREFGGTGLGLAISQRLANLLGGEIEVASVIGQGSRFRCTIDIGDVASEALINPSLAIHESLLGKRPDAKVDCKILVVDDRRDVRFLAGHILRRFGADVWFAENGLEGTKFVDEAIKKNDLPDLILMDMQMPVMDGYEATATLRKMGFKNPIIALTADAMQGDMDRCIASGCDAYISKPIDSDELLEVVQHYSQP
jgi:PAS domain S-box-containing protein